jgi:hypothetical protein
LRSQLAPGWAVDSTSAQHSHPWPMTEFAVAAHDDVPVRMRLVAPRVAKSEWQTLTWVLDVDGRQTEPAALRVYVGSQ